MTDVVFIETGPEDIDMIRPMWEKLRDLHLLRSPHFKDRYEVFAYEDRKAALLKKAAKGKLRIDIAKDAMTEKPLAYCISSISDENEGEIDSIFVDEDCRLKGIGHTLMKRALSWMDASGVSANRISVAAGNEEVLDFYRQYGFYPRYIILELK
jgi:ribosomal protein S18 acetylase RimI-like enzyme